MENKIKILNEGEPWETLQIGRKVETWEIRKHQDGDIEISCAGDDGDKYLFLSQDGLKKVIEFL